MVRCEQVVTQKSMPFIQLLGDQPFYALINEVKYENPEMFKHILPVLGGFHIQCAFMATIYQRFRGSGLEDWVVASGIVEAGSFEVILKMNPHYFK